jgi:hypothetical protein
MILLYYATPGPVLILAAFIGSRCRSAGNPSAGRDHRVAIYSLQAKTVSRSAGRSVAVAAAYRAAEKIADDRLGVVWDFTSKRGVLHSEIMTPAGAPDWAQDRADLWHAEARFRIAR